MSKEIISSDTDSHCSHIESESSPVSDREMDALRMQIDQQQQQLMLYKQQQESSRQTQQDLVNKIQECKDQIQVLINQTHDHVDEQQNIQLKLQQQIKINDQLEQQLHEMKLTMIQSQATQDQQNQPNMQQTMDTLILNHQQEVQQLLNENDQLQQQYDQLFQQYQTMTQLMDSNQNKHQEAYEEEEEEEAESEFNLEKQFVQKIKVLFVKQKRKIVELEGNNQQQLNTIYQVCQEKEQLVADLRYSNQIQQEYLKRIKKLEMQLLQQDEHYFSKNASILSNSGVNGANQHAKLFVQQQIRQQREQYQQQLKQSKQMLAQQQNKISSKQVMFSVLLLIIGTQLILYFMIKK